MPTAPPIVGFAHERPRTCHCGCAYVVGLTGRVVEMIATDSETIVVAAFDVPLPARVDSATREARIAYDARELAEHGDFVIAAAFDAAFPEDRPDPDQSGPISYADLATTLRTLRGLMDEAMAAGGARWIVATLDGAYAFVNATLAHGEQALEAFGDDESPAREHDRERDLDEARDAQPEDAS